MKTIFTITTIGLFISMAYCGCKKDDKSPSSIPNPTAQTPKVNCDTSIVANGHKGGCYPRLVTPAMCETIDLTNGKTYEFAWTTDGTNCETPWTFQIAGNPITPNNLKTWQLNEDLTAGITRYGGLINLKAADLDGLTTDNGLYHWTVASFYDSYPASKTFKVKQ